ncbi:carboxylesterase family domain-containing protein [Phthorimaea operculella]|nr:carboxylesterase family domain-containing protein [Phthorimaea operculella]
MASDRHTTRVFIYICLSFSLPMVNVGARVFEDDGVLNDDSGVRLTREYHLQQGALRGMIVKPSRNYDLQLVEMFLGIPYAAPPVGSFRFMPPASAPPWPGVKKATRFAPVCPQSIPPIKKGNPPSLGRQHYMSRIQPFLANEAEDCLYLNIYVPFRAYVQSSGRVRARRPQHPPPGEVSEAISDR